jgi:ERCC4-type nuclease
MAAKNNMRNMRAVLLVDFREGRGAVEKATKTSTGSTLESELFAAGVPVMYTALPIGDYLWAAAPEADIASLQLRTQKHVKVPKVSPILNNLRLLGVAAERKAVSDLVSSLVDGRFDKQKAALCATARRGDTLLYILEENALMVENFAMKGTVNSEYTEAMVRSALLFARATTLLQGFTVLRTSSIVGTARALAAQLPVMERRAAGLGPGGRSLRSLFEDAASLAGGGGGGGGDEGIEDVSPLFARVFGEEGGGVGGGGGAAAGGGGGLAERLAQCLSAARYAVSRAPLPPGAPPFALAVVEVRGGGRAVVVGGGAWARALRRGEGLAALAGACRAAAAPCSGMLRVVTLGLAAAGAAEKKAAAAEAAKIAKAGGPKLPPPVPLSKVLPALHADLLLNHALAVEEVGALDEGWAECEPPPGEFFAALVQPTLDKFVERKMAQAAMRRAQAPAGKRAREEE